MVRIYFSSSTRTLIYAFSFTANVNHINFRWTTYVKDSTMSTLMVMITTLTTMMQVLTCKINIL